MSLWYEVIRILGITIESKEIERILNDDVDPEEKRLARLKLKPFVEDGEPKRNVFRTEAEYNDAIAAYNKIKGYYDKLANGQ